MPDFFRRKADGVHEGSFAGGTVHFEDDAIQAKQNRAAVDFRVEALL
jgi:hypothetical protein